MRLRNVRGAEEKIASHNYTIQADDARPEEYKGHWRDKVFLDDRPVHIEVGMGKGQFILRMAEENPLICYIGIEKYSSVLVRALDKLDAAMLQNVRFLRMDAEDLEEYFAEGEIDKVYLNFSDPWPKERHAKRRLTSLSFLERYQKILKQDGILQFKTDNRPLFDFSLGELEKAGWKKEQVTFDLHKNGPAKNNIMTEYEEKFYQMGNPICMFVARRPEISRKSG